MVALATIGAGEAAGDALHQGIVVDLHLDHRIERLAPLGEQPVERLCLSDGAREAIEDERTCVVWGMPRSIKEAGLEDAVVPLDAMPLAIAQAASRRAAPPARMAS